MTAAQGNRRHVEISSDSGRHKLMLDGIDLSGSFREATLTFEHGSFPKLTLEPVIIDASTYAEPTAVYVSASTVELLISLGWTPPADSA